MKHRLAILLIGILCVAMLPGCNQSGTEDVPGNAELPSVEEELVVEEEPLPDIEDTIFAGRMTWNENDYLYEVPTDVLAGVSQAEVHRMGNNLLLVFNEYDGETNQSACTVKLVSIENGEVLGENKLTNLMYATVQVLDNHVAVNDLGDSKCYLLDKDLKLVDAYDLLGGTFCLNAAGEKAYLFTYDRGIKEIELSTGTETVLMKDAASSYLCKSNGKEAAFVYTDLSTYMRESCVLDLTNGTFRRIESPYAYSSLETSGDTWLGKVDCEDPLYVLADGENQNQFYVNFSSSVGFNQASGHVILSEMIEDGATTLDAYDVQGNLISRANADGLAHYMMSEYVWYDEYDGYVFTMMDENGQDHLMFWQISEGLTDSLVMESVEDVMKEPAGSAVSQELFDLADVLSEKYGVEIYIADQCDTEFTDHRADLLLSEEDILQTLNTLDYAMGRYPEGFFEQLKHNTHKKIEIQILGVLEKDYSTEETTYVSGGFVNYMYPGKYVMALDGRAMNLSEEINPIVEELIYHEFSHIIDKRMEYFAMFNADAAYSDYGWESLNPEGYVYNDSYYGNLDPQYADYFVDAYACTNGTEDRARTMEYAMGGYIGTFAEKKGLTEKLEYYCKGIRDSFDTTGWTEVLPWEETLNAVR